MGKEPGECHVYSVLIHSFTHFSPIGKYPQVELCLPQRYNTWEVLGEIRTIIFDLGGVIIDLDVDATMKGFSSMSGLTLPEVREWYAAQPVFKDFEKGLITEADFRQAIREAFSLNGVGDEEIDRVWNAMLADLPVSRLHFMQSLMARYRVMILSNTNSIHVRQLNTNMLPGIAGADSLNPFAHEVLFSHDIHLRKPDRAIFRYVLEAYSLVPGETMFLDDNPENVAGAREVGIRAEYITHPDIVFDLFNTQ